MTITHNLVAFSIAALVLTSCGGNHENSENQTSGDESQLDTTAVTVEDTTKFKFDFAIANIPSPAGTLQELSSWGLSYDNSMLNDPNKAETYTTEYKQSINLGMYNIDMAHAMVNDNGADVLKYMKTALTLGNKLGLTSSLNAMVGKRAETNLNNKDSLFELLDEIFVKSDYYLRTNERVYTAATIFAGSWVESLYLTAATAEKANEAKVKEDIRVLFWKQRMHLGNLLSLLADFKSKSECAQLINDLNPIYEEIVSAKQPLEMTNEKMTSISAKLSALRNKLAS